MVIFLTLVFVTPAFSNQKLPMWIRPIGFDPEAANPPTRPLKRINLTNLKTQDVSLWDIQYGKTISTKAVPLVKIIEAYGSLTPFEDTVILHFQNGMMIPIPLAQLKMDAHKIWLALAIKSRKGFSNKFPASIPPDPMRPEEVRDNRKVNFFGRKLLIRLSLPRAKLVHSGKVFSPWIHVDTLKSMEFVNYDSYVFQFMPKGNVTQMTRTGLGVYARRCLYCHGLRHRGGSYGWDYKDPLPLYEKRPPANLHNFVKYPKWQSLEMGIRMPFQGDITNTESNALWHWLKAASQAKALQTYKPK